MGLVKSQNPAHTWDSRNQRQEKKPMYKVQRLLAGEWIDWTEPLFPTYEEASRFIFTTMAMAEVGESAKDINRWRPVEVDA